jgi:uncharacterized membrane protein SpoIIM required for sporulation/uncharacterized RDD family membrane protein YckC
VKETTRLATPENIELEFRLAGPGSRLLALLLDWLISGALYTGLIVILVLAGFSFRMADTTSAWLSMLVFLAFFLIRWGYYLFFEVRLRGQTPGKRALGIRVVREGGLPVGIPQSLIRNLLRIVDSFPQPLCIVGGVCALATRRGQRLGDLAAGTIVIRERFRRRAEAPADSVRSAGWVSRLEQGLSRTPVVLPRGQVSIGQIALIEEYFRRVSRLGDEQRRALSWRIAQPLLPLFDQAPAQWEPAEDRLTRCESLLQEVLDLARKGAHESHGGPHESHGGLHESHGSPPETHAPAPEARGDVGVPPAEGDLRPGSPAAQQKARMWDEFARRADELLRKGRRGIARLGAGELRELLRGYRGITSDLARAQSMGADPGTIDRLNKMAISGHVLIYGYARRRRWAKARSALTAFPKAVRENLWAVVLSSLLFFCPAVISSIAVAVDPASAYDLVGPDFYDFRPASSASMHSFPPLMRPVVASRVMTNNLQVAIIAFAFGLSAGVGTAYVLVSNGMHVGAVAGWLGLHGQASSLWGWIMPHGGTEILAIIMAGAAGFLIAKAILSPGPLKRSAALRVYAMRALALELGCMAMLVVAGIIEGFFSPSSLGLVPRLVFAGLILAAWGAFFTVVGKRKNAAVEGGAARAEERSGSTLGGAER